MPTKILNYIICIIMHIKLHKFILNITFSNISIVIEWNKLAPNLGSIASLSVFEKNLCKFI